MYISWSIRVVALICPRCHAPRKINMASTFAFAPPGAQVRRWAAFVTTFAFALRARRCTGVLCPVLCTAAVGSIHGPPYVLRLRPCRGSQVRRRMHRRNVSRLCQGGGLDGLGPPHCQRGGLGGLGPSPAGFPPISCSFDARSGRRHSGLLRPPSPRAPGAGSQAGGTRVTYVSCWVSIGTRFVLC